MRAKIQRGKHFTGQAGFTQPSHKKLRRGRQDHWDTFYVGHIPEECDESHAFI